MAEADWSSALPAVPRGILRRAFAVRQDRINVDDRTVELSFSSEEPFERWWGIEILDHSPKSIRLGRLNGGAAVLVDHDTRDQVGVVVEASIGPDRKGRATVRFGKSQRAQEVFQDVADGIRTLVSVGYAIHGIQLESEKDGQATYRVTDWEPYEISLVAVPADPTVGVGRDATGSTFDPRNLIPSDQADADEASRSNKDIQTMTELTENLGPTGRASSATFVDPGAERAAERERIKIIQAMGARLGCAELAQTAIDAGRSVEEFVREYEKQAGPAKAIRVAEDPAIGMDDKDVKRFSFIRLLNAIANPHLPDAQRAAAFELECSGEAQRKVGGQREFRGFTVPVDVLRASILGSAQKRDLTVGTATAGGHTVATDLMSGSFIDLLRNRMVVMGMGTTLLTDLNGNLAIPRATGGATAYWLGEGASPTESAQAFDQVGLTPKTVGAFTDISRRLLIQSSIDVEAFVRSDLATTIALAIDAAAINGSGSSNQPTGILNTAGIGSVAGGTNGAAPTWDHVVDLETAVSVANADIGALNYLTNAKVRGKLKKTQQFSGTNGAPVWGSDNMLNGYSAKVSNQVPANLTKGTANGVCSAVIYGNFADLLIGMWGGLDLTVDPYTNSTSGTVRIVALQDVDVAVRHAASFAAMLDALTA